MKIFIVNSDFGVQNTIGARTLPIVRGIKDHVVYCRSYNKEFLNDFNLIKVVPFGKFIMKFLTAIPIYVSRRFQTNNLKRIVFEYFLIKKLKGLDFDEIELVHSWDFLPNAYRFIKKRNKKIKIYQDVPMAFGNILEDIKDKEELFGLESLELNSSFYDSFKYIDKFIVPSEVVKDSLIKEGIIIKKINLIPFGVDTNKFKPIKKDNSVIKFIFLGNINNRKGIKYLIQAWKELDLKNAELNLCGRVYPEVKRYLKDHKDYNIFLKGFVDSSKELPLNDVYIFPSLLEGSSKSIYEAMACGLPIITTYNSGSIIKDGEEGFIIPIQDVGMIKKKILFFINNEGESNKFSLNSRSKANGYSWERYGNKMRDCYES